MVNVRASASRVAVTPSGMVARCFPWPRGSLYSTGNPELGQTAAPGHPRASGARRLRYLLAPVAVLHLAHDHTGDAVELARQAQLVQVDLDHVRGFVHLFEEQDRAVEHRIEGVPIRCTNVNRLPPTIGAVALPGSDRRARTGRPGRAGPVPWRLREAGQRGVPGERRPVGDPHRAQPGSVQRGEAGAWRMRCAGS